MTRIYIAGPCSGIVDSNYPAFNAEASRLRALGYLVENPAENPAQADWAGYMRVAIRQMLTCDIVALLHGWADSRGAILERSIAMKLDIPVSIASAIQA